MPTANLRHFLSATDLPPQALRRVLERAQELKASATAPQALQGRIVALLFEKPSLRTRVSFEVGVRQLGGGALYLGPEEVGLGKREPVADVARILTRMVDAIVVRCFAQETLEQMARYATVPVINALSDAEHPCQALADLLTIREAGKEWSRTTVAYVGDGNNVAASLVLMGCALGVSFRLASPPGYELPRAVVERARALAAECGSRLEFLERPEEAVQGADVVYTDVWTSMGQEDEAPRRRAAFQGFQVTPQILDRARADAIFLHPLPAHPGEEVSPGLLDDRRSVVFQQAENRLHAQKALLVELFS